MEKGWYNFKLYALCKAAVREFVPNVGAKFGVVREWNFCTSGAEVKAFRNKRKNGDILICLQWRQIFQTSASIRNKRKKDLTPSPFCAIILVEGAYR